MRYLCDFIRNSASLYGGAILFCIAGGTIALADPDPDVVQALAQADVVLLGEVHDNPAHHLMQADLLTALAPGAVVWEMISQTQAEGLGGMSLSDAERVAAQLNWAKSGWPEFALYAPVFAAAQGAQQFGAQVPRSAAKMVMEQGAAEYFGQDAALFGLDKPLPDTQQQAREADQMANHCNALPIKMLPLMVEFQRLRDAALAAAVLQALQATAGPVVVITGNGHARKDRGVPAYLAVARPDITVMALGQAEDGQISGEFDLVLDAEPIERPDPCLAFQKD